MTEQADNKNWDIVIHPHRGLFDVKLGEVWRYRDLLWLFVRRDFVSFYKQTILGPLWFFIQPIFTTIVYIFLFGNLAGLSTDGLPAPLFYLVGITAWTYFSDCLIKVSGVLRDNAGIFGKVYFPRLIIPLSIVISNLVKFAVQLLLLAIMMVVFALRGYDFGASPYIFLFPLLLLLMAAQGLGWGMLVSAMATKYRDLAMLVNFSVQLLLFATPVVYPLSSMSGKLRTLISLNPMTSIIEGLRLGFLGNGTLELWGLCYTVLITCVILISGIIVFNKVEKSFVDTI